MVPFSMEKNLGKAYNEAMQLIPDGSFACFRDSDTCFLTPDGPAIVHEYVNRFPDTDLFTCFTNRLTTLSPDQLLKGRVDEHSDIRTHINYAQKQKSKLYEVTQLQRMISGFLMVINKETWKEFPFREDLQCLTVDNNFSKRLLLTGKKVLRMDGLYIFHIYRMEKGIFNKEHLK